MKYSVPRNLRSPRLITLIFVLCLGCTPTFLATVHERYLPPGKPNLLAVLVPPPAPGSAEQAADLESTVNAYETRSKEDLALANVEKHLSPFLFTSAVGPFFKPGTLPATETFLEHVQDETGPVIDRAKLYWDRPRPYLNEPRLKFAEPEPSSSYPSGHSTRGTVYALVLAELFPEKSAEIRATGENIGWHRVQLGKHFPTDVYAGRTLGQAIFNDMKATPAFQHDLARAQREIAAFNQEPRN